MNCKIITLARFFYYQHPKTFLKLLNRSIHLLTSYSSTFFLFEYVAESYGQIWIRPKKKKKKSLVVLYRPALMCRADHFFCLNPSLCQRLGLTLSVRNKPRVPKARESARGERRAKRVFCRRRKRFCEANLHLFIMRALTHKKLSLGKRLFKSIKKSNFLPEIVFLKISKHETYQKAKNRQNYVIYFHKTFQTRALLCNKSFDLLN